MFGDDAIDQGEADVGSQRRIFGSYDQGETQIIFEPEPVNLAGALLIEVRKLKVEKLIGLLGDVDGDGFHGF